MIPREYSFIDTEGMLDWQKKALEHIHVYDRGGERTVLYFDYRGGCLPDHHRHRFYIPIQYFAPESQEKLCAYLQKKTDDKALDAKFADEKHMLQFIEEGRSYLEATRPADFLYKLTPEEERQVARVFVELNKYPAISSRLVERKSPLWLIAKDNEKHIDAVGRPNHSDTLGYYSYDNTIVIGESSNRWAFRHTVAEETIHAFDITHHHISKRVVSDGDIEEARKQVETLKFLALRQQYEGMERANITFSPEEKEFLRTYSRRAQGVHEYLAEIRHQIALQVEGKLFGDPYYLSMHTFAGESILQTAAAFFQDLPPYKDIDTLQIQGEFFSKTLKTLVLRRHLAKYADQVVERDIENELFPTKFQQTLIAFLDRLTNEYQASYPPESHASADRAVEALAGKLERERPGITSYVFSKDAGIQR